VIRPIVYAEWSGYNTIMNASLEFSETDLAYLCMEYHVQRLMVFGSALGDAFGPESDIDLLVEFEPDTRAGYFLIVVLQDRLAALFGREVDLLTDGALNPRYRQSVMASAQVLYEREIALIS